jgi:hypothetical protein
MSAKHSKKGGQKPASKPATPAPAAEPVSAPAGGIPAAPTAAAAGAGASGAAETHVAWMDSADPQKRMIGKIVFVGVWIYVAALWLLALDQTFHWGIFGPKGPPVP